MQSRWIIPKNGKKQVYFEGIKKDPLSREDQKFLRIKGTSLFNFEYIGFTIIQLTYMAYFFNLM